ncbi:heparinase II/III domain-containing protein [Brachybacterium sp. J153]|uniref:heparinase II/III domain-containing protein n=1 Tax=Brachybacterium sp. J153 TaxID=3116488 RepID=UPI002E76A2C7|nr:heparinase II/III family protein [Brachybacterium sp. J153]MEE1617851.1 heparinase II/III family protein [Brachybacterium sp. J153]
MTDLPTALPHDLSTGHGERTEIPGNYRRIADQWSAGVMHTSRYPDTVVGDPVDWTLDAHDGSWLFRLHNMEYLFSIYRSLDESGEERYRELAQRLIESWIAAHPEVVHDTPPWMRHTTAMRAQALAFAAGIIPASEAYVAALHQHGAYLADPANYSGAWNHGFDESLALLAVGATVSHQPWIDLAVQRATEAITAMCDLQGATNEQASVYHYYVWKQFGQFEDELDRCGIPHPPVLRRRRAIVDFLVHASRPDGMLLAIGDSLDTRTPPIPGTPLEYVTSRGATGEPPARRIQVFDRGWAFARSGWGTERPFAEESVLALRFGPGRAVHGHSDHTSFHYYTGGREVIGDAGFSGYANPERRAYELGEYGHGQVLVAGAGPYRPLTETRMVRRIETPQWEQFVLADAPYRGVARERTVTFLHDPECVLVHDTIRVGAAGAVVRQLLHAGPSLEVADRTGNESIRLRDGRGELEIRQLLPVGNIDVSRGQRGLTTTGWAGAGLGRTVPSAVLTSRSAPQDGRCDYLTLISPTAEVAVEVAPHEVCLGAHAIPLFTALPEGTHA